MALPIPESPFDPSAPFTPAQARAAGVSRAELLSPAYTRLMHGLYVSAGVTVSPALLVRAVLGTTPDDGHASHSTAAELLGLWVPKNPQLHVCRPTGHRHSRSAVVAHQCPRHGPERRRGEVIVRHGVPTSAPAVCFAELSGTLPLVELVALGDAALAVGGVEVEDLRAAVERHSSSRRVAADGAFRLIRPHVESAMESRLRVLLVMAGLPEPVVNLCLRDASGRTVRRLDLAYPQWMVAVEYDGRQHQASDQQWYEDILRRDELTSDGWRSVIVLSRGIYREPLRTVERVERALVEAGWRGRRRPMPGWQRHFPGY